GGDLSNDFEVTALREVRHAFDYFLHGLPASWSLRLSLPRPRLRWNSDVVRLRKTDRARISGVCVTKDTQARITRKDSFEAAFRAVGSIGHDHHSGVLRITDADS